MDGELTEEQWALIRPLLPPSRAMGCPRADDRRTVTGLYLASLCWVRRQRVQM